MRLLSLLIFVLLSIQQIQSLKNYEKKGLEEYFYYQEQINESDSLIHVWLDSDQKEVIYLENTFTYNNVQGSLTLECPQDYYILSGACSFLRVRQGDNNYLSGGYVKQQSFQCNYNTYGAIFQNDLQISISCSKTKTTIIEKVFNVTLNQKLEVSCPQGQNLRISGGACSFEVQDIDSKVKGTYSTSQKFECDVYSPQNNLFTIQAVCSTAPLRYEYPFQANVIWMGGNSPNEINACGQDYYPIGGNCQRSDTDSEIFGGKLGEQTFQCAGMDYSQDVTQIICMKY